MTPVEYLSVLREVRRHFRVSGAWDDHHRGLTAVGEYSAEQVIEALQQYADSTGTRKVPTPADVRRLLGGGQAGEEKFSLPARQAKQAIVDKAWMIVAGAEERGVAVDLDAYDGLLRDEIYWIQLDRHGTPAVQKWRSRQAAVCTAPPPRPVHTAEDLVAAGVPAHAAQRIAGAQAQVLADGEVPATAGVNLDAVVGDVAEQARHLADQWEADHSSVDADALPPDLRAAVRAELVNRRRRATSAA